MRTNTNQATVIEGMSLYRAYDRHLRCRDAQGSRLIWAGVNPVWLMVNMSDLSRGLQSRLPEGEVATLFMSDSKREVYRLGGYSGARQITGERIMETFIDLDLERRRNAVRIAALQMDTMCPGWYAKIDEEILDIFKPDRCILCQTFGSYSKGYLHLVDRFGDVDLSGALSEEAFVRAYAFASSTATPFWLQEITARLEADTQSDADKFLERTHEIINQSKEAERV